jgi:magnesium chelatase accessory protein
MRAGREVRRGGIRWYVEVEGEGPVLLLLHGTGASSHSFRTLAPLLAPRFTVVTPDLPGHGQTRPPSWFEPSLPCFAAAVDELLDELQARPAVVVGHSAGAAVGARMILDRSVDPGAFIGLAAALTPLRGLARRVLPGAARALSVAVSLGAFRGLGSSSRVDRILRSTGSALEPEGVASYAELFQRPEHVGAVLSMMAGWELDGLWEELPALRTETLLIAGSRDRAVPLADQRAVAARLPRGSVQVVRGAGHLLHEEHPLLISQILFRALPREVPHGFVDPRPGRAVAGVPGGDGVRVEGARVAALAEAAPVEPPRGVGDGCERG